LNKIKILGGGSYQTAPENSNNPRIPEELSYLPGKFYSCRSQGGK